MSAKKGKKAKVSDEIDFCWGKKKGRGVGDSKKDTQFYHSFRFDGVEYSLFDSIYLFKDGEAEPYVGKILKIWEDKTKGKKNVKILWFFRPSEISNHLHDVYVLENELFLATGVGPGLFNVNPLEAIAGKCNVVCISKDYRNVQPSVKELEVADFVFYRTFDVKHLTVSDKLDETIATVDVKLLLNQNDPQPVDPAKLDSVNVAVDTAETLISAEGTLVALPKCDSSEKHGAAVSNSIVPMVGEEKKAVFNKDAVEHNEDVKCGSGLDFSMVKEGDAAKPDTCVVASSSKRVLKHGQETTLNSPDLKIGEGAVIATAADNVKPEPVNDVKKRVADGPSKKRNLDASARKITGSSGTVTQKSANVSAASNKVSEPTSSAAETYDGGKLTREPIGLSDTLLNKRKNNSMTPLADVKSSDKSNKASGKLSKDLHNSVSKAPHHPGGDSESNGRGKLRRKSDVTGDDVSKKRRPDSSIQQPNSKLGKMSNKDDIGASNQTKEVTQQPDTSKWFSASTWEDRIKNAADQEKLVFLQNLDPTYSSSEVEKIIMDGFKEKCAVQIVQRTATSSSHSGQAFAIFNTQVATQKVINRLERDCLILPNGRPLVGTLWSLPEEQRSRYFGQLLLGKARPQMQKDGREAGSTSHSAQPNTIEYELALEWLCLQKQSDFSLKRLNQLHGDDIKKLKIKNQGEDVEKLKSK